MAAWTYDEALRRLLAHEGGYTNHPSDPGGPTNFGITIYDYRKYVKPNATAADVRAMTVGEAKAIYRKRYWDAQRCDELPAGVDYSVFDYGVNSGIGRSGKVLRRVVGLPDNTHVVTDEVLRAVARRDPNAPVVAINDERLAFLKRLKTWPVFRQRMEPPSGGDAIGESAHGSQTGTNAFYRPRPGSGARQGRAAGAGIRQESDRRHRHHRPGRCRWPLLGLVCRSSLRDCSTRLRRCADRRRLCLRAQPLATAPPGSRHFRNARHPRTRHRLNTGELPMLLYISIAATLVAVYWCWIRPILKSRPAFRDL
jgi:Glycosyl hydrolase 108